MHSLKSFWAGLLLLVTFQAGATIDIALQMQLGNPSNATSDPNNHSHYLIQRAVQAIDYNDTLGQPNWASWNLTSSDLGTNARSDSFFADTNLPSGFNIITSGAYGSSGYDRGHMCPSADRTITAADNDAVFFMSNIVPQSPVNNSGIWGQFEGYCRNLTASNEVLIICGPSGFSGKRINTNGAVFIPDYVWKIVVVVPTNSSPVLSRITNSTRVIALKVPNTDNATNTWPHYVTSARQIEVDTGFTFFTTLSASIANILRDKVDGATNPPPVIFGLSTTNCISGDSVVVTGTNFDAALAVTFGGIGATFTVNSGTQITAIVPTNGSSGFMSVTTPSGTAISSNSVVVNGGITVFSGMLAGWDVSTVTGGNNNYGISPLAATSIASNITVVGLTRGSGISTNGNAAAQAWGGLNFTNSTATAAIAAGKTITLNIAPRAGYKISFTTVSKLDYRRSATGASAGVLQYQIGSGAFNDIAPLSYPVTTASGGSIAPIDLSNFAPLQNLVTNVTFRIVNYLGTGSTGSWYVSDVAGNAAPDLVIKGTVTSIVPPTLLVQQNNLNIVLSWPLIFDGFTLQQTTAIAPANWTNVNATITTNGMLNQITLPASSGTGFFRLVHP